MSNKYTVTFKVSKPTAKGNPYLSKGYMWYELQTDADKSHPVGLFYEK